MIFTMLGSSVLSRFLPYIIGGGILFVVIGYLYWDYTWTKQELETVTANYEEAIQVNEENKAMIQSLQNSFEELDQIRQEINIVREENSRSISDLERKFDRESEGKRSLGEIAEAKPESVQRIINNATEKVLQSLENETQ